MRAINYRSRINFYQSIITYGFILSLASYPLDEYRVSAFGIYLPYSALLLIIMLITQFLAIFSLRRVSRPAIILASLFGLLIFSTLAGRVIYGFEPEPDRLKGLLYFLAPFAIVPMLKDRNPHFVFASLVIACTIPVYVGWTRYFGGDGGSPLEHAIGYWGIRYLPATRNSDVLYPLALSTLSLFGLNRYKGFAKLLCASLFILGASAVALSLARGGWLALAWAGLIMSRGGKRIVISLSVLSLIYIGFSLYAGDLIVNLLVDRFSTFGGLDDSSVSNLDRLILISDSVKSIFLYPFGVGFGNMGWVVSRFGVPLWNSENGWLTVAVEGGWASLIVLMSLTGSLIRKAIRAPYSLGGLLTSSTLVYLIFNYELNSAFMWALLSVCWHYASPDNPATPHTIANAAKISSKQFDRPPLSGPH